MKTWAWAWLAGLALLGWAPGLGLSYFITLALALGAGWRSPYVFGLSYFSLFGFCLLMQVQVRKYFGLAGAQRRWFTWAGGGALAIIWVGAYIDFGSQVGWF